MRQNVYFFLSVLIGAGIAVGGVTPAHAAQGNLEVSLDGVTFSKTFSGALFDGIDFVVPGDEQGKRLFLRNSGDAPGFLRVVLEDVVYSDLYFANALTVQATASGSHGAKTAISMADPCLVLTEGQRVEPGQTVALDTQLALGNLDGQQGMGATASFSMAIALSDTTPGSLPPTECGQADFSIPLVPRGTTGGGVSQEAQQTLPPTKSADFLGNSGGNDLPVLNLPGGIVIDPNTWDLLEELFILLLVVSFLGGGAWFIVAARRRHDDSSEESEGTA